VVTLSLTPQLIEPFGSFSAFSVSDDPEKPGQVVVTVSYSASGDGILALSGQDLFGTTIHVSKVGAAGEAQGSTEKGTDESVAIGIDLGTTYSCCAVWRNDKVEIVPNENGNFTTPSYVSFANQEVVVGDTAKGQCSLFPKQTVFDAKRLIGRRFSEEIVRSDCAHWSFKVVETAAGSDLPAISVQFQGAQKNLLPEEVSSMVLYKMKEIAEKYLGRPVTKAVVTVPAYFNDAQRHATKAAGAIAGLEVLRIINEPTAAAIAYGLDVQNRRGERNVLVFDLGGGTFDVTLLSLEGGVFHVKATAGDTHLGGEDFDSLVVDDMLAKFRSKHPSLPDPRGSDTAMRRLRTACERAKRTLSVELAVNVSVDNFCDGVDLSITLSRGELEGMCSEWFLKTIYPIERVLKDSKISKNDVHEIVLVGGSTRIPKVQSMISNFFNGKVLNKSINADEAVAYGAAVQAAILSGVESARTSSLLLLDIIPLSIGLETVGGIMTKVIPRNTTVPTRRRHVFTTDHDNQDAVIIQIFEGERQLTKDCNKLGEFTLTNLPKMPRGVPQIEVTLDVDANGLLSVRAVEKSTGARNKITITNDSGKLSKDDVHRMVKEAETHRQADQKQRALVQSRNRLNEFAYELSNKLLRSERAKEMLSSDELESIEETLEGVIEWIDDNDGENGTSLAPTEVYEEKLKQLSAKAVPLLKRCGFVLGGSSFERPEQLPADQFNGWSKRSDGVVIENCDP
jgi:heat shock 70kDa protein 1/2/6/8